MSGALITLGRLPKGLELARALHGAGCRTVIAEPWSWHLSRLSRSVDVSYCVRAPNPEPEHYLADLCTLIEEQDLDLVIPVSEEVMHVAALHGRTGGAVRLYVPEPERLLQLHDKLAFNRLAASLGLPVPETHALDGASARAFAGRSDFIVKPSLSSAGKGLTRHRAGAGLPGLDEPGIVQAYLPGEELSSFSICHRGRVIGTVVYRGRIVSGTVSVCFERLDAPEPALLEWIGGFAAGTGHSGFLSLDFRRDGKGRLLPMECNPRTTSGIHFVDPRDLAKAILEPDAPNRFRLRSETVLQQFYPALTETQGAFFKGRPWRGNLRDLFGCRDVCWQRNDPWPFLLLPVASWEILRRTLFRGQSFGEATTEDIGWYR